MIIVQDFSAPNIKAPSLADDGEILELSRIDNIVVVTPSTQSTQQVNDVIETVESDPVFYNEGRVEFATSIASQPIYKSLDESIATIDQTGKLTRVSDGVARIVVSINGYAKRIDVDVTISNSSNTAIASKFVDGSLGQHLANTTDGLLDGKNKSTHGGVYTSQDHTNRVFVRNPNVWTGPVDLTCISPSNSGVSPNWRAGVAVTPQHILLSAHFDYGVGTIVYFVDNENNTISRTVVASVRHPDYAPYYPDLTICTLDQPLPASITPCKVCPANVQNYIVETFSGRAPCLVLDQEEKALVSDLQIISIGTNTPWGENVWLQMSPTDSKRMEFYENIVLYDSGNPCFFIADLGSGPELILNTLWTYGGAGIGTAICGHIADINQMILNADTAAALSTGYTLTEADFSSFPIYV